MLFAVVHALGELAVLFPIQGSFAIYGTRFLDPAWGYEDFVWGGGEGSEGVRNGFLKPKICDTRFFDEQREGAIDCISKMKEIFFFVLPCSIFTS